MCTQKELFLILATLTLTGTAWIALLDLVSHIALA